MPRGNLRLVTPVGILPHAGATLHANVGTLGTKPIEARTVDRREWQGELEASFGGGFDLPCGAQRPLAFEIRTVTGKTDGPSRAR